MLLGISFWHDQSRQARSLLDHRKGLQALERRGIIDDVLLERIARLWNRGFNTSDIASKLNIEESKVYQMLPQAREKLPKKKLANHDMQCKVCRKWSKHHIGPKFCGYCRRKILWNGR